MIVIRVAVGGFGVMKKILIFYKRKDKQDKLTKEKAEAKFGKVSHFESIGWIKSKKSLDTRGIRLYLWESVRSLTFNVPAPVFGKLIVVYYLEI